MAYQFNSSYENDWMEVLSLYLWSIMNTSLVKRECWNVTSVGLHNLYLSHDLMYLSKEKELQKKIIIIEMGFLPIMLWS